MFLFVAVVFRGTLFCCRRGCVFFAVVPGARCFLLSSPRRVMLFAVVSGALFFCCRCGGPFSFLLSLRGLVCFCCRDRGPGLTPSLASWVRAQTTKTNVKQLQQKEKKRVPQFTHRPRPTPHPCPPLSELTSSAFKPPTPSVHEIRPAATFVVLLHLRPRRTTRSVYNRRSQAPEDTTAADRTAICTSSSMCTAQTF